MAVTANVTLRDSHGRTTTKRIETAFDTLANAKSQMTGWAADWVAVSDLGIAYITYTEKDDAEASDPEDDSNLDVGATFSGETENGKTWVHKIPGIKADLVAQGVVDLAQEEVTNYFANFEDPQGCLLSDGEQIATLVRGTLDR